MSITKLVFRFALLYALLLAVTFGVISVFDLKKPGSVNTALLMVTTMWVCSTFAEKTGAPLQGSDRLKAILGMFAVDQALQIASVWGAQKSAAGPLVFALITVGAFHLLAIYAGTWAADRYVAKIAEKARTRAIFRRT